MRIEKSVKNIKIGLISQIVLTVLGFISRKIFVDSLGAEYLGVNGLLTNVLSAMVLIEGGIGISITYNLYKPLADNDKEKIIALIQIFKKSYAFLALILLAFSCALYPVVKNKMITGAPIKGIFIVYFLFVFKSIISYLFAYKWALINADQRGYVLAKNNLIFQVISMILKIVILVVTENYILYLIVEFLVFVIQNVVNTINVNKLYPYIKAKRKYKLDNKTKKNITKNIKAMFVQNMGSYIIFSTDNIVISTFISTIAVGLYSNYTMVMGQLAALVGPIIGGIGNSIGNLLATENEEKSYSIFKITFLISFWIYSFTSIFLYNLLNPFISWWLGEEYLLGNLSFVVLIFNFYLNGMRTSINIFKSKSGLFANDKYAPLIEGIINLVLSLIFIKYIGLAGVFLGTTCSYLLLSFWNQPRIVFKECFKKSVWEYFSKYIKFAFITIAVGFGTAYICNFINGFSFLSLVVRGIICVVIINLIYIFLFKNSEEFKYLKNIFLDRLANTNLGEKIIKKFKQGS